MKLAKSGNGQDVFVGIDDRWFPLREISGYESLTRVGDLVGDRRFGDLEAQVRRQAAGSDGLGVDLSNAATIVDSDAGIWGAGLNYRRHSEDLDTEQPGYGPGSYLRPTSCLIGNGGTIRLPAQSRRVTAEAELGLVVGTRCKDVPRDGWRSVIAGVTAVLDMTAEDAIRRNPRYIPWAKGFDTFCSIGPALVTLDEFPGDSLDGIRISTVRNGEVIAAATPRDMKYDLGYLVEYFTMGRTLVPGTVICTGTPGAVQISPGDTVRAAVEGVGTLTHPVG
ncbi:fumarylacetoacetate hydrolase family protein [Streptomyces phyllanthi]|uniref:Fumarylacetoacetate hydrolase family protein n=1 Tax=Streptomyces phyllanthi TaxID=1803180 RepID=A0A5N8VWV4_9ACTN|nr:fumarylacetoacetate hydrolase family protein [Streptomyces phyllanthi]MPY39302.1 fumarylacetoacetate hydrolase family protein [Streptomyces phyllanthi]